MDGRVRGEKKEMRAFIDGSSNGLYGYLLMPSKKLRVIQDFPCTNNQAEWLALLTLLMDLEADTKIQIYSDSQIVVNQLTDNWQTLDEELKHLKEVCRTLIETKKLKIEISWIPRNENLFGKHLDKLVGKERRRRKKIKEEMMRESQWN